MRPHLSIALIPSIFGYRKPVLHSCWKLFYILVSKQHSILAFCEHSAVSQQNLHPLLKRVIHVAHSPDFLGFGTAGSSSIINRIKGKNNNTVQTFSCPYSFFARLPLVQTCVAANTVVTPNWHTINQVKLCTFTVVFYTRI